MNINSLKSIIRSIIEESKQEYQVYHKSYTSAIKEVEAYAEKKGYTLDPEQLATDIGMGPRKPKDGATNKFSITIFINGKPQKKCLQVQVYGRGAEGYELNLYVL